MKMNGSRQCALIGAAGLVGLCMSSVAMGEIDILFEGVSYVGSEFERLSDDMLTGSLDSAAGDFILDSEGENFTWCDDLTVLIGNFDGTELLVQIGGYTDLAAANRFTWPTGASGDAGTVGGGEIEIGGIDVSGYSLWLGNGYVPGGAGVWTGAIDLTGSIDFVPAPGALALLGLGGLAARRRRK